jgi:outer membrane receptor protein involved in Fe transport
VNTLQFSNSGYTIHNNLNSVVAELNSNFAQKISNKLQVSYSAFRDYRELPTGQRFPMIDFTQDGTTYASVGTEQFSAENRLDQNIFQVTNNLSYFANGHILTGGFTYEQFGFVNDFNLQRFGYPFFGGLDIDSLFVRTDRNSPRFVDLNAIATEGGTRPVKSVEVNVAQLGLYAQDEWQLRPNFKLTLGLRADLPIYMTDVNQNAQVAEAAFLDPRGNPARVDVTNFPKATPLWSPRVGFNYSRTGGEYTTQVRGGTGIFTGRIPFVWIGNQASNAGFDNFYTFQVNATADNFRFPQVWRSNLAVDQELPGGVTATAEFIFTKDLNAAIHRNYNLVVPTERATGADNRLIYPAAGPRLNTNFTGPNRIPTFLDAGVIVLENTRQGYQYSLTGQLQKNFTAGLYLMGAYTFARAKDVTSNPGEIAADAFQRNPVIGNANTPALGFSDFGLQHRVIAAAGKRFEYAKFMATTVSFFFEAGQGGRFSYTYAGDMNRDGVFGNDLIFVPASPDQIRLVGTVPAAQQWEQLDAYIAQDKYLSSRRGQYAERNGAISPWFTQLDVKLLQDFFVTTGKKKHTFQLSFDIQNVGNLLNRNWGERQIFANNRPVEFVGYEDNTPTFRFSGGDRTFVDDTGINSRWRAQFGLRYIFE